MPKPAKGARLGSGPAHEKLLLSGLAAALIREERIRTTQAKAKRLKPVADRLVTLGKAGTVHARRQALAMIEDRDIIHKLFDEVAPRFADRNGGYTRVLKLGPRKGDAAPMAIIEFVEGETTSTTPMTEEETKKRRLPLRRKATSKPKATQPTDEEPGGAAAGAGGSESDSGDPNTRPTDEGTEAPEAAGGPASADSDGSTRPDEGTGAVGTARLEAEGGPAAAEAATAPEETAGANAPDESQEK